MMITTITTIARRARRGRRSDDADACEVEALSPCAVVVMTGAGVVAGLARHKLLSSPAAVVMSAE